MVATLTNCHLEDIECGKYQLVFASAENVLKQILLRVNLRVQLFVALKNPIKWKEKEELSNRLKAAILKDFRSENIVCSKYQLIFMSAEEVLSQFILFWLKKKLFHRFTHRLNVCLFRWITVLPVFNLTNFDRLPAHFRKCSDTQLTRGFCFFSTASSCRQASSRPSPATYPYRPLKL